MAKVGVLLAGCGVYDGSEIHEAVISLLALDRAGAEIVMMAPAVELNVVNHLSGDSDEGSTRNVLEESARIARGNITDIKNISVEDIDALLIPGGFGAAKNLCNFASEGPQCDVNPEVARLVKGIVAAKKPLAALCIAPAMVARVLGEDQLSHQLTIGTDESTAAAITQMGANHVNCPVDECVIDTKNKIISSPAYMLAGRISEAAAGIEKTVKALMEMI